MNKSFLTIASVVLGGLVAAFAASRLRVDDTPTSNVNDFLDWGLDPIDFGGHEVTDPFVETDLPRGIRNHNPGNILDNDNNNWQGKVGVDDAGFVIFSHHKYGIRAMVKLFRSYANRGKKTISEIIYEWAPPQTAMHINPTENYVNFVAESLGKHRNTPMFEFDYPALIAAIIRFENGSQPYSDQQIHDGIAIA